jgi:hypothetical protein
MSGSRGYGCAASAKTPRPSFFSFAGLPFGETAIELKDKNRKSPHEHFRPQIPAFNPR